MRLDCRFVYFQWFFPFEHFGKALEQFDRGCSFNAAAA